MLARLEILYFPETLNFPLIHGSLPASSFHKNNHIRYFGTTQKLDLLRFIQQVAKKCKIVTSPARSEYINQACELVCTTLSCMEEERRICV